MNQFPGHAPRGTTNDDGGTRLEQIMSPSRLRQRVTRREMTTRAPRRRMIALAILFVTAAILIVIVATFFGQMTTSHQEGIPLPSDMLAYWGSTNLLIHREDPYNSQALLDLQKTMGWTEKHPLVAWNPPILHVLLLPLGALPFHRAAAVWFMLNLLLIRIGAVCTWSVLCPERDMLALLYIPILTFSFPPSLQTIQGGQVTALVLLGTAGFLVARSRKHEFLAGACCVLLLVKPHLVYVLLPLLLIEAALERRWAMLAGFGTALFMLLGIATCLHPSWPRSYVGLLRRQFLPSVQDRVTPTVYSLLRVGFGTAIGRYLWLLLLPPVIWLFLRYRHKLDLPSLVNWALIASLLTTPFGWASDHVLLLVPILEIIARSRSYSLLRRLVVFGAIGLVFFYAWWFWVNDYQQLPNLAAPLATAVLYGYSSLRKSGDASRNQ